MIRKWLTRLYIRIIRIRIADNVLNVLMDNEPQILQPQVMQKLYDNLFISIGINKILSFAYRERQYDAHRFQILYIKILALYTHHRQSHASQFYHWYGWLFGHPREQKITASNDFIQAITQGNDITDPPSALTSGVLGAIYQQRHRFFSARALTQAQQQNLDLAPVLPIPVLPPPVPSVPDLNTAAFSKSAAG